MVVCVVLFKDGVNVDGSSSLSRRVYMPSISVVMSLAL